MRRGYRNKEETLAHCGGNSCYCVYCVHLGEKDVAAQFAAMPAADMLPILITSVAVTAAKVALLAGAVLLVKWLIGKFHTGK